MSVKTPIYLYLCLVNVYLFILMGVDARQTQKQKEKKASWRVPSWQFLTLGLAAGGLGGLLGMAVFDHKKDSKRTMFLFQLGGILAVIFFARAKGWL